MQRPIPRAGSTLRSPRSQPRSAHVGSRNNTYFYTKRVFDLIVALFALVGLSLFFLIIAIWIKLDSPGPVFFRQNRVGARRRIENGKVTWKVSTFSVFKFRSMFHNVDQSLHQEHIRAFTQGQLEPASEGDARFKIQDDPRITRVGHVLRRTSIDELPQLLNVLRGEMSLVGPRPVPEYEVAEYDEWHYERLHALPGITGLWQVHGRGRTTFDEMVTMDIEYVRTCNLWVDIKLLLRTIPAAITCKGAK